MTRKTPFIWRKVKQCERYVAFSAAEGDGRMRTNITIFPLARGLKYKVNSESSRTAAAAAAAAVYEI